MSSNHKNPFLTDTEKETDPEVLKRREKQIEYGKITERYQEYIEAVPKNERKYWQPRTPKKDQVTPRRIFDGEVQAWKKKLHYWNDKDECTKIIPKGKGAGRKREWKPKDSSPEEEKSAKRQKYPSERNDDRKL
ncbi:Oidioi.mRNA.OKI2018_I69.chr2.g7075.t1.cds [Oikopleura dioica]|uniref:Oidioi.mRNA.OKI2018_I69.chr2.g7075.t1.cds n=1 Tax=Oikopleura dioica TaxID=34765 RepID=A0ABN7T502_OIKDI|nr:Oidioi.mRNA.OKI2018_I69.chr2.g7075.t1.cds [Oikopleura dioica]